MDISPCAPLDRISNLPDNVIDDILTCLTLHDAAKTSVLAKQWRDKWLNLPQLIFDDTLWQRSEKNKELARMKFLAILYKVLLRHQGPIIKLSLIVEELRGGSEIDDLVYFSSKKGVEEFNLALMWEGEDDNYKLPSSLYKCLHLKHLSLCNCIMNPPPSFKGFNKLIRLKLINVTIGLTALVNLIRNCLLLEELSLEYGYEFENDSLEIDAPMLKLFALYCHRAKAIHIKRSPHLATVSLAGFNFESYSNSGMCMLGEFFNSVPTLRELHMDYCVVKLFRNRVPQRVTACLQNLKRLKLSEMTIDKEQQLYGVLFLIRNSANLEELNIVNCAYNYKATDTLVQYLRKQDYADVLLNRLREITWTQLSGVSVEMFVVKLLLEKSPMLKRMVISSKYNDSDYKFLRTSKELNKFRRASPNAEVILEG